MKKYLVLCVILCTFLLGACQVKSPVKGAKPKQSETVHLEKAKNLEVGVTYKISDSKNLNGTYIRFVDDKHYVNMNDRSHYTKKDIAEKSGDGEHFYPHISFTEGEYSKEGENYVLKPARTQRVEFKDPQHVNDKVIAFKRLDEGANAGVTLTIAKKDGGYAKNNQGFYSTLYKINKKLPNSIEDFIDQYDYQPEELHW